MSAEAIDDKIRALPDGSVEMVPVAARVRREATSKLTTGRET